MIRFCKTQLSATVFFGFWSINISAQELEIPNIIPSPVNTFSQQIIDQSQLELLEESDQEFDKTEQFNDKPDSLLSSFQQSINTSQDSILPGIIDSLKILQTVNTASDSITNIPDELPKKVYTGIDSIRNSLKSHLTIQQDSLDNILDSLNIIELKNRIDRARAKPDEYLEKINSKVSRIQDGITKSLGEAEARSKINKHVKIDQLNIGTDFGNLVETQDLKQQVNSIFPANTDASGLDPENSIPEIQLEKLFTGELPEIPPIEINDIQITERLNEYSEKAASGENQVIGLNKRVDEINQVIKDPEKLDEFIDSEARRMEEVQEMTKLENEMGEFKSKIEGIEDLKKGLMKDAQFKDKMKQEAIMKAMDQSKEYISESRELITKAQTELTGLKKKYMSVPSMNDLDGATRRNSLSDQPFRKRLSFGGNIQIRRADPLSLDLSPTLGYYFNKVFLMSVSANYRIVLSDDAGYAIEIPNETYGFSLSGSYKIFKGFFGHIEGEAMSVPDVGISENNTRTWNPGLMIGIGKEYKVYKSVRGRIYALYDVMHSDQSPDPKAFQIKIGFFNK